MPELTRRRLFQAGTGGLAAALAGCSAPGGSDDTTDATNGQERVSGDDRTVTVFAQADQEAIQEAQVEAQEEQQEIQQEREAGEISEEEAQQRLQELQEEFQETQQRLSREAVETITDSVGDTDGLNVDDSIPAEAILLVSGNPTDIIDLLPMPEVAGLVDSEQFEEFQAQEQP